MYTQGWINSSFPPLFNGFHSFLMPPQLLGAARCGTQLGRWMRLKHMGEGAKGAWACVLMSTKLHLCQTDKSPSATITFPSKATSIFLVSSNVIAPEACWIGPGKGDLETAKSTSQQSSSNLGRNVITFEFNSFPSFFSYSPVLISFHSRWRS